MFGPCCSVAPTGISATSAPASASAASGEVILASATRRSSIMYLVPPPTARTFLSVRSPKEVPRPHHSPERPPPLDRPSVPRDRPDRRQWKCVGRGAREEVLHLQTRRTADAPIDHRPVACLREAPAAAIDACNVHCP